MNATTSVSGTSSQSATEPTGASPQASDQSKAAFDAILSRLMTQPPVLAAAGGDDDDNDDGSSLSVSNSAVPI